MTWAIEQGEVVDVLRGFNDSSFDALACDPPYGFSFMGKKWDYDVPSVDLWRECLRVLKPGAPLVAFGGSRTYHRLACGIEDAGFELRDQLMFLYGKGFPKSLNVSKAIDKHLDTTHLRPVTGEGKSNVYEDGKNTKFYTGETGNPAYGHLSITAGGSGLAKMWDGYGTALKPAHEPIVLARKPMDGTVAENVLKWGCGGLAIDACRIGMEGGTKKDNPELSGVLGNGLAGSADGSLNTTTFGKPVKGLGRWPANLVFDEDAAAILDEDVGPRKSGLAVRVNGGGGQIMSGIGDQPFKPKPSLPNMGYMDGKTNPSRFFYCAKVSTKEREAGCEALLLRSAGEVTASNEDDARLDSPRTGAGRTRGARNHHPTLKPISLTTWLTRLIMPPSPGVLLVPFAGAGSEMIGALKAGWPEVFGIEREEEYATIARARLTHWCPEVA